MRDDIINYLKAEVRNRAESENNKFGIGVLYHIEAVVKNAEILAEKYNADKKACIINHRGSTDNKRLSKEEQITADADAISHFDNVPSLLYLAYKEKNMSIEEGKNFVKSKLERSF